MNGLVEVFIRRFPQMVEGGGKMKECPWLGRISRNRSEAELALRQSRRAAEGLEFEIFRRH